MFSRCSSCSSSLDLKIRRNIVDSNKQIQWYQWRVKHGFSKKEEFNGSGLECVAILEEKFEAFSWHVFIKRQQSAYFERLKLNLDNGAICIQVDFSGHFHIDVQDAIQSSFYSKDSISLFTCYICYLNGGYSCVYHCKKNPPNNQP